MTELRIGVVCEGASDFLILEWSLKAGLAELGLQARFRAIHPVRDRTSGGFSDGGWRQVYRWCLRNDLKSRGRFFGDGLFDGDEDISVDVILVHIDGDLLAILKRENVWETVCQIDPHSFSEDCDGHLQYATSVLERWLFDGSDKDNCLPTPTVLASEAWLLAGLSWHEAPESALEPKTEFAREWLARSGKAIQPGLKKLSDHLRIVRSLSETRSPDANELKEKCSAYVAAIERIAAIAPL